MVTAVDIENAETYAELTRLRGTCRACRTKKLKELRTIRADICSVSIDTNEDEQAELFEREAILEAEISSMARLADLCSTRIDSLATESCTATSSSTALAVTESSSAVESLVAVITDVLNRTSATDRGSKSSQTSKPSLTDVNKFNITSRILKDEHLLSTHFRRLEEVFSAVNFGVMEGGNFIPHHHLQAPLIEKLLETLKKHDNLVSEVNCLIDSRGHDWQHIRSSLLSKYCNSVAIRREFKKRVAKLSFKGPADIESMSLMGS